MPSLTHRRLIPRLSAFFPALLLPLCAAFLALLAPPPARAEVEPARLEAFMQVTGFDVMLDSIALSAETAPRMLGMEASDFGGDWARTASEVFDPEKMHDMARQILTRALQPDDLAHAAEFYASDLGQRLVETENASHMDEDRDTPLTEGQALVAQMLRDGAPRLEILKRMNRAVDVGGYAVRAVEEVQIRFLMAAAAAGVIEMKIDSATLRVRMAGTRAARMREMAANGLARAAHIYAGFSDDDLRLYAEALEAAPMARVYELMNAVQYEIMANRYEALAARMAGLYPGEEL